MSRTIGTPERTLELVIRGWVVVIGVVLSLALPAVWMGHDIETEEVSTY